MRILAILAALAVVGSAQAATVFSEDFNAGGTGAFAVSGSGAPQWADMSATSDTNYTNGTGNAMTANSDFQGSGGAPNGFSTSATVNVNGVGFSNLSLSFSHNFQVFSTFNEQFLVKVNGITVWSGIDDTAGGAGFFAAPGVNDTVSLAAFDNTAFVLEFVYSDPGPNSWEWYAQVDDVVITGNAVPEPASMIALGLGVAALARRRRSSK